MLNAPLKQVLKTTAVHLNRLKELGITTVSDFLKYFPARYTDSREIRKVKEIIMGEVNTLRVTVRGIHHKPGFRGRMSVTRALLGDETGAIEAIWFNQNYIGRTLQKNMRIITSGKIKYDAKKGRMVLQNPQFEIEKSEQIHMARLTPIYHETELWAAKSGSSGKTAGKAKGRLSSKWIRDKLFPLMKFTDAFPEFLPETIRKQYELTRYGEAVSAVHFPKNEKELEAGRRRLAFDELFFLQLAALYRRHQYRKMARESQKSIAPDWELMKSFSANLPWPLTNAQKKAIYEIIKDLGNQYPMTRLLEGDVGSGKTVVAAAAMLHVIRADKQACLLAPTEILARQHMETLSKTLKPFSVAPALLVGAMSEKEKRDIVNGLKQGKIPLVVGTHAILQQSIGFANLALAIIDEQHRFGVRQRELLRQFGSPHILHLTATPIPRTLALICYGDQDISILDELPPGRQIVNTRIVPENKRKQAYEWIEKEIQKGRQAFIIFPLIEESEILQVKAATTEYVRLQNEIFPHLKLALLHGQMPSEEKETVMKKFKAGDTQILVSTSVVEVGVDVPNATIMMIEGAERFGLAQLHQFRGRVGRGTEKSYCFLFPTLQNPQILQRLHALEKYHSGFKLAEIDLNLRGPGEVYGTTQSGIPDLKMASFGDAKTIKDARDAVESILGEDPDLAKYPELKKKILEQENVATGTSHAWRGEC